jgi:hypothetical protein
MTFARIHHYLSMAMPLIYSRQQDNFGASGSRSMLHRRNSHVEELAEIYDLLTAAQEPGARSPRRRTRPVLASSPARRPAHPSADIVAMTTVSDSRSP